MRRGTQATPEKRQRAQHVVSCTAWLAVGVVGLFLASHPTMGWAQAVIASASLAFGIWVFWTHGGPWVTAAGVYSLATAVFVGYAGLWWLERKNGAISEPLLLATAAGYFSHVAMYALLWGSSGRRYPARPLARGVLEPAAWATNLGLLLTLAAVAVTQVRPSAYVDAAGFVGVTLFVVGVALRPSGERLSPGRTLFIVAALGLYVGTMFEGYGRLVVAALGFGIAAVVATRFRRRLVKAAVALGAPLAVAVLDQIRTSRAMEVYGPSAASVDDSGPGSMVTPLETFARLISPHVNFTPGDGSTFWATLVVFVPRSLWPDKPVGFGTELTRVLEPGMAPGHSMAALSLGEWYYNWQWPGVVAMVLAIGLVVRWLDHRVAARMGGRFDTRRRVVFLTTAVIAVGGLGDLVWVGTFTYGARAGMRIAVLLVVLALFAWREPDQERRRAPARGRAAARRS